MAKNAKKLPEKDFSIAEQYSFTFHIVCDMRRARVLTPAKSSFVLWPTNMGPPGVSTYFTFRISGVGKKEKLHLKS